MSYGKKGRSPGWKSGGHWSICDVCGFSYRNEDLLKRWDGQIVCEYDFEERHPQDLVRGVRDDTSPKGIVSPDGSNQFTTVSYSEAAEDADYAQIPSGTFTFTDLTPT